MTNTHQKPKNMETACIRPDSHAFSIELFSKGKLKTISIPSDSKDNVVLEGYLGELVSLNFLEDALLEIHGANGTFRIDLKPEEIAKLQKYASSGVKQ